MSLAERESNFGSAPSFEASPKRLITEANQRSGIRSQPVRMLSKRILNAPASFSDAASF
jgi:hypothetical protein